MNKKMSHLLVALLAGMAVLLLLASCSQPALIEPTSLPSQMPRVVLTLYHTPTPSPTSPPLPVLSEIPLTPAPTPTPFTHVIVKGDTLGGIALRYSVNQEDLLGANPGIDPQFLRIGDALIVPLEGELPQTLPTSTPFPALSHDPVCYSSGEGGLFCFMLVENNNQAGLENLIGWIGLDPGESGSLIGQTALSPLNVLWPGEAVPLMAHFEAPVPDDFQVRSELLTSLLVPESDERYLSAEVENLEVRIDPEGRQAFLLGHISLSEDQPRPRTLWVAAVAYASTGEVVGVRKWDIENECPQPVETAADTETTPQPELVLDPACLVFEFSVYSLGPEIERVELLLEARP